MTPLMKREYVDVLIESARSFVNTAKSFYERGHSADRYTPHIARFERALDGIEDIALDHPTILSRCYVLCYSSSMPYTIRELPEPLEGVDQAWVDLRNLAIIATMKALNFKEVVSLICDNDGVLEMNRTHYNPDKPPARWQ